MSTEQILREPAHANEETQTHVASNKVDINILMEKNDYKLISKFGVTCFYTQKENLKRIQDIMNIQ